MLDFQGFTISFSYFMFTKLFTHYFQAAYSEQKKVAFHPHGLLLPPKVFKKHCKDTAFPQTTKRTEWKRMTTNQDNHQPPPLFF